MQAVSHYPDAIYLDSLIPPIEQLHLIHYLTKNIQTRRIPLLVDEAFVQLHPGAHAVRAPTMFAVVREQAWVEFGIRGIAHRACAFGGVHIQATNAVGVGTGLHGLTQAVELAQHMHHAFAVFKCGGQGLAQCRFVLCRHLEAGHRQLNGVLLLLYQHTYGIPVQ